MNRWRRVLGVIVLAAFAAAPPVAADPGKSHPCCEDTADAAATPADHATGSCGQEPGTWCDVAHCTGCTTPLQKAAPGIRFPAPVPAHVRWSSPPLPGLTREGPPAPPPRIA